MKVIEKMIDMIFKITSWVITALFSVLVIVVFLQVLNRSLANSSLTWSTEIANYSMMWIALLGSAMLLRSRGHMAISNIIDALHGFPRKLILIVSVVLQALFVAAWIYGCLVYLPTMAGQHSPVLRLDMAMVNSIFLITGVLMMLAIIDCWIVKKGEETAYSEEDELIHRVQEKASSESGREV